MNVIVIKTIAGVYCFLSMYLTGADREKLYFLLSLILTDKMSTDLSCTECDVQDYLYQINRSILLILTIKVTV